jgi:MFS family permease
MRSNAARDQQEQHIRVAPRRPSIWDSILIMRHKSTGMLILAGTIVSSGSLVILVSIPALFMKNYHFNALQVGLCYLPYAAGGLAARWTVGSLADRNFKRCGRQAGVVIEQNRQTAEQLRAIPLEKARLQLTMPLIYVSAVIMTVYGWVMQARVHVACPLILLFLLGNLSTGMRNSIAMLVVDLHAQRPATAIAALSIFRSFAGAGIAAAIGPLIDAIGAGWTGTLIAGIWLLVSPVLWVVYFLGHKWRKSEHSTS